MKLKPFHNQVVLKQLEENEQKVGSIIISDLGKELPKVGTVIAVGPGSPNFFNGEIIPVQAKIGDKVAFPAFGGIKFSVDGEDYIVVKDPDLITVIED
jgi:chaperonin GroES